MKLASKLIAVVIAVLPGVALAHPGHAPLAGLPDLLLHQPWVLLPMVVIGVVALRAVVGRRLRARARRR